ncbi:N-acylneuraminate cytidylyltransferase [compost metagenome]
MHALDFFKTREFKAVLLLQPTSPFRRKEHVEACLNLFDPSLDMVTTVYESKANPYFNLLEEDQNGFLVKSKESDFTRRQDCPPAYELNGAVYVINGMSIQNGLISRFERVKKVEMSSQDSIDLDVPLDWKIATLILSETMKTKEEGNTSV